MLNVGLPLFVAIEHPDLPSFLLKVRGRGVLSCSKAHLRGNTGQDHVHQIFAVLGDQLLLPLHHEQERNFELPRRCDQSIEMWDEAVSKLIKDEIYRQV